MALKDYLNKAYERAKTDTGDHYAIGVSSGKSAVTLYTTIVMKSSKLDGFLGVVPAKEGVIVVFSELRHAVAAAKEIPEMLPGVVCGGSRFLCRSAAAGALEIVRAITPEEEAGL